MVFFALTIVLYGAFSGDQYVATANLPSVDQAPLTSSPVGEVVATLVPRRNGVASSFVGEQDSDNLLVQALSSRPLQALSNARATCEPSSTPDLYCVYTVKTGETLSGIAKQFGPAAGGSISATEMLAASNIPDVLNADEIIEGQKLRIPALPGIIHTVLTDETVNEVADEYGVSALAIKSLPANGIGDDGVLAIGQVLLIPSPSRVPKQALPDSGSQSTQTPDASPIPPEPAPDTPTPPPEPTATTPPTTPKPRAPTPTAPNRAPTRFVWPAVGSVSSYFGPSHPLGIDIDFFANPNQPVAAAAAGTVTFAGGDPCCSYGYYVVIEHAGGFTTLYAHLSKISVKAGQSVTQAQTIGLGGRTGYATGNHLHFEVRLNGKVVNPLSYLP